MKKSIKAFLLAIALVLSSCAGTPKDLGMATPVQVPDLPEEQFKKAGPLPPITADNLAELQIEAAKSDAKYNDVAINYNRLIDFYNCVQESVNKRETPNCL